MERGVELDLAGFDLSEGDVRGSVATSKCIGDLLTGARAHDEDHRLCVADDWSRHEERLDWRAAQEDDGRGE
jgi:hypothetical protein